MSIGPVQLLVLGFTHPDFSGEVLTELERLRDADMVRVIDSLVVRKDAAGAVEVDEISNITTAEAIELGSKVGALVGLGAGGEKGMKKGAKKGAQAAKAGISAFSAEQAWDVIDEIPPDSAAALVLLEHHWAVPLRDAVARSGGFPLGERFVSPLDLVEIGLITAAEADQPDVIATAHVGANP